MELLDKKRNTRLSTRNLVLKGKLKKSKNCEICNKKNWRIFAHHISYDLDSIVIWVCIYCHAKIHNQMDIEHDNRNYQIQNLIDNFVRNIKKEVNISLFNSNQEIKLLEKINEVLIRKLEK